MTSTQDPLVISIITFGLPILAIIVLLVYFFPFIIKEIKNNRLKKKKDNYEKRI